jgi:hypothetical protein
VDILSKIVHFLSLRTLLDLANKFEDGGYISLLSGHLGWYFWLGMDEGTLGILNIN